MKTLLGIAVMLGGLAPIVAAAWYVPVRLLKLLDINRTRLMRIGWAALVVLSFFGMLGLPTTPSAVLGMLYVVSGLVFMAVIYLFMALLVLHIADQPLRLGKPIQAWIAIAVAVGFTVLGVWFAGGLDVNTTEIHVPGLERDLTVMHISDVHLGHHRGRAFLEQIVDITNRQQPDLVLITGDLVDGNSALSPRVLEPLSDFVAPAYFVTGNHEAYVDTERALQLIAEQGIRILNNERIDTHGIQLVGLDYMNPDEHTFDMHPVGDRTIQNELPKIPVSSDEPIVLLHHSPVGLEYIAEFGTDLMLSGHTHAGQVFPGTLLAPLIFRMNQGLYDFEGMRVFVSEGAGTYMPRMRLGSSNTIDVLKLVPGDGMSG